MCIYTCNYTYIYEYIYTFMPFKLKVSFAKEPHKRDYILQKRPMISRSLLIVATPYRHKDRGTS